MGPASVSFQPSELAKWSIIFFLAGICCKVGDELRWFARRFVPICAVVAGIVFLILVEDMGTAAFICLVTFFMLLMAGANPLHVMMPIPVGVAGFGYVLINSPWRLDRLRAFMHPELWAR